MALALDGTPADVSAGSGTSFTIGTLSTTYANGYAIVAGFTTGHAANANITSISGGGLAFTSRSSFNSGPLQYIEEWVAPITSPLSNVTLTVNLAALADFFSYCFFAVSNGGNGVSFDAGGPQTVAAGSVGATMTTSETAFIICSARFTSPDSAPTPSAPWAGIYTGVTNSFLCIEDQLAAAGTYTGAYTQTHVASSIIDALYAATPFPWVESEF